MRLAIRQVFVEPITKLMLVAVILSFEAALVSPPIL